jgi:hypothetical protein
VPARRAVLAGVCALLTAGCGAREESTGGGTEAATTRATDEQPAEADGPTATDQSAGTTTDQSAKTATDRPVRTATPTGDGSSLDRREANVVGVAADPASGGHRFDVTLFHDDEGEDGYANWWAVEALDGTELGRRELGHAHGTREFTRSATVDVGDRDCVVVRGHDQTHGYGGRAAVVDVGTGATRAVDQGPDRQAVGATDCP